MKFGARYFHRHVCPRGSLSGGGLCPGGFYPGGFCPGGSLSGRSPLVKSGQYASCLNAFLSKIDMFSFGLISCFHRFSFGLVT